MNDQRSKLLKWRPGDVGFSHDEVILAVGLQCREKNFAVADAISWMGRPDKAIGDSHSGQLVYFFHDDDSCLADFEVVGGRVTGFGTLARGEDNAIRLDEKSGDKRAFNILDVMHPFDEKLFK